MKNRSFVLAALLVILSGIVPAPPAIAQTAHQDAAVRWHPQTGLAGPVDTQATATLVRRSGGVTFTLHTSQLRPGHAYTVWFVVLNNPAACAATPCSAQDILLNPATDAQVTYGAGHISGGSGRGSFAGSFTTGPIAGWLPDRALSNPLGAEVQLVLNDHGPKLTAFMPAMIQTYRAGCTDASLPPIFPPSARADGAAGPNTCQLYQVAVFGGS
jgi:hypothetical protein